MSSADTQQQHLSLLTQSVAFSPACQRVSPVFSLPQQAQTTRVRPTAIRPTLPTARPGDSPTPAY